MRFQRTAEVPVLPDYRAYRDPYLRPDFQYRCAYCLTHEFYFLGGEGGEIDHHRPLHPPPSLGLDFSHLRNAYENLYWSCAGCNGAKGNRWPTVQEQARGEQFLDPCAEDHEDHWETRPDGTLLPKTPIGRYTVARLRLNRRRLVQFRRFLAERQAEAQEIETLLTGALSPQERLSLDGQLVALYRLLQPPVFDL